MRKNPTGWAAKKPCRAGTQMDGWPVLTQRSKNKGQNCKKRPQKWQKATEKGPEKAKMQEKLEDGTPNQKTAKIAEKSGYPKLQQGAKHKSLGGSPEIRKKNSGPNILY